MRLLLLTTSYPAGKGKISGIFVKRLVDHLGPEVKTSVLTPCPDEPWMGNHDEKSTVLCFRYAPTSLQVLAHKPGGIPAAFSADRWRLLLVPAFLIAMFIATIRRSRHCDIIHANWSICGVVGGLAGKLLGKPVVTTLRGQDVNLRDRFFLFGWMLRGCLQLSDMIVCVSQSLAGRLTTSYPAFSHRIRHVPNGIDPDLLNVERLPRQDKSLRMLHIGSLIPRKDVATIITAVSSLPAYPGVSLEIVGDGPERNRLQALSDDLGISHRIRFHGKVSPERIAEYLQHADALILASLQEGRPNVVLEAMAAGVPVVTSNIEGVDELVEEDRTGLLFRAGSAVELSRQLERLLSDPDLGDRLAGNARQFIVNAGLIWSETARRYEALYRALINASCAG